MIDLPCPKCGKRLIFIDSNYDKDELHLKFYCLSCAGFSLIRIEQLRLKLLELRE